MDSTINKDWEAIVYAIDAWFEGMKSAISFAVTAGMTYMNQALLNLSNEAPLAL